MVTECEITTYADVAAWNTVVVGTLPNGNRQAFGYYENAQIAASRVEPAIKFYGGRPVEIMSEADYTAIETAQYAAMVAAPVEYTDGATFDHRLNVLPPQALEVSPGFVRFHMSELLIGNLATQYAMIKRGERRVFLTKTIDVYDYKTWIQRDCVLPVVADPKLAESPQVHDHFTYQGEIYRVYALSEADGSTPALVHYSGSGVVGCWQVEQWIPKVNNGEIVRYQG